jgi:hypothetical protein
MTRALSVKSTKVGNVSWHSARLLGKTVSGTDFGDRMGRAESALDTLSAARNRDRWRGVRYRKKSCLGSSVMCIIEMPPNAISTTANFIGIL